MYLHIHFIKGVIKKLNFNLVNCRTEHIPGMYTSCVPIYNCMLSTLNSTPNVILGGNWVSHHHKFRWTFIPSQSQTYALSLLSDPWSNCDTRQFSPFKSQRFCNEQILNGKKSRESQRYEFIYINLQFTTLRCNC